MPRFRAALATLAPGASLIAALAITALLPVTANAAPITREYTFNGTNIVDIVNLLAPQDPPVSSVFLKFRVTFDPLQQQFNELAGTTLIGTNLALGSAFQHSYIPTNMDRLVVGGAANGTLGTNTVNDDFTFDIRNAQSDTPILNVLVFTTSGTPGSAFRAFNGTITSTAVPEPAGMALLMAAGALALGAARRRRA